MTLTQKLLAHGGIYAATRVATQALGLVLVPIYARRLQEDGYGVISLLGSVAPFLSILFAQGMISAWFRLRHDYPGAAERRAFEATIVWYLVPSGLATVGLLSLFGGQVAALLGDELDYFPLVFLTVLTSAFQVFAELFLRQAHSDQQPGRVMAFSLPRTFATLVAIIVGVVVLDLGPIGKVGAEAVVAFLFGMIALGLIRPGPPTMLSGPLLKRALGYGLPLIPHSLVTQVNSMATRILLTRQLSLSATGVYSMGAAIVEVGNVVVLSLNQGFSPLFIAEMKRMEAPDVTEQERADAASAIARAGLTMVVVAALLALGLGAAAREVLSVLTTPAFDGSHRVVALLGAGLVARACYFVFSQPLFYTSSTARKMPRVSLLGATLNVGACALLLPYLGIEGAAVAVALSNAAMAGYSLQVAASVLRLPHAGSQWTWVLGTTAAALTAMFFADDGIVDLIPRVAVKLSLLSVATVLVLRAAGLSLASLVRAVRR